MVLRVKLLSVWIILISWTPLALGTVVGIFSGCINVNDIPICDDRGDWIDVKPDASGIYRITVQSGFFNIPGMPHEPKLVPKYEQEFAWTQEIPMVKYGLIHCLWRIDAIPNPLNLRAAPCELTRYKGNRKVPNPYWYYYGDPGAPGTWGQDPDSIPGYKTTPTPASGNPQSNVKSSADPQFLEFQPSDVTTKPAADNINNQDTLFNSPSVANLKDSSSVSTSDEGNLASNAIVQPPDNGLNAEAEGGGKDLFGLGKRESGMPRFKKAQSKRVKVWLG